MAIGIRTVATGTDTGSTASVSATTTGTTPVTGDLALVLYRNDYYTLATMGTPSGGSITWNAITGATADGGTNLAHLKAWWGVVASTAHFTVTATETGAHDEEKALDIWVLSGADTTTPIDASAGSSGASTTSQDAPTVSPSTADAFLIVTVGSGGGSAAASYTHPAGTTEQYEIHVGGLSGSVAYQQLSASGATGVRNFTASTAVPFAACSIAIKTASAGAVIVPKRTRLTQAVARASFY